jgi:hypothetical protein
MTLGKTCLALGVCGAVLFAALAPAQAQSAGRMWTGRHHHYFGHHHRGYNYGTRTDARRQTRSGGPVGGLRDRN